MANKLLKRLETFTDYEGVKAKLIAAINTKTDGEIIIPDIAKFADYDEMIDTLNYHLNHLSAIVFTNNDTDLMNEFKCANIDSYIILEYSGRFNYTFDHPVFDRLHGRTIEKIDYYFDSCYIKVTLFDVTIDAVLEPRGIVVSDPDRMFDRCVIRELNFSEVRFIAGCDQILHECPKLLGILTSNERLKTDVRVFTTGNPEVIYNTHIRSVGMQTKSARN